LKEVRVAREEIEMKENRPSELPCPKGGNDVQSRRDTHVFRQPVKPELVGD
jgi:hypothetical protein